jgi:hypothetical protein
MKMDITIGYDAASRASGYVGRTDSSDSVTDANPPSGGTPEADEAAAPDQQYVASAQSPADGVNKFTV